MHIRIFNLLLNATTVSLTEKLADKSGWAALLATESSVLYLAKWVSYDAHHAVQRLLLQKVLVIPACQHLADLLC